MSNTFHSGGLNDTTGREPFEDDGRDLIGRTEANPNAAPGVGNARFDGNATAVDGDNLGSTTGFANQTSIVGEGEHHHKHHHHHEREGGLGGRDNVDPAATGAGYGSGSGMGGNNERYAGQSGDAFDTQRKTGDYKDSDGTGGILGNDRVDATGDREGHQYGQNIGDKNTTNQHPTRHGDDFTGGFAATGGAYTNEYAKTGLTGRETTTTGVADKDGNDTQSGGIMGKIKNALGSHKNDDQGNENPNPNSVVRPKEY